MVQVLVKETGYGTSRIATLNGVKASSVKEIPILNASRVIVGYYVIYEFTKLNAIKSARFQFAVTSLVFPYRRLSGWVTVK